MPAHVVVGANAALGVAHEDDRFAGEFEEPVVPGLRNLRGMACEYPVVAEDSLAITLKDCRVREKGLVERVARPLRLDQRIDPAVA